VKLLVATRSPGKQREVRGLFAGSGHEVTFPEEVGLWPIEEEDRLETADSFAGNARRKAEHFARRSGLPTVADDSGLEVLSLGGAPGVRSRRWAGAEGPEAEVDRANNAELLRRLLGAPAARRRARYRCVLVLLRTAVAAPETFEGACAGTILEEPRGEGGFGYDPLFLSDELGKAFGEAAPEEKAGVSHRGRAFRALLEALGPA
jgi:XTP/dITP diphosphohydrolase